MAIKKSTTGFLIIVIVGLAGILLWRFVSPILFKQGLIATSDAPGTNLTLRIGGDNYLGYWFITSPEMRKQAARKGLSISFADDGGAYAERLQKFADREYDGIVLPVNSYLEHGAAHKFPGVIVAAICESKGADGIVGFADKLPSGKINDLNDPSLAIVYTPSSPSSFLLNLTIADFDLDRLRDDQAWRVEANGSQDVLKRAKQGKGDVFVLWEPDLSKAMDLPGMTYIWGSDRFSGYILDVMVFHRDVLKRDRQAILDFMATYFRVMGLYANNRDKMLDEMARATDLKKPVLSEILKKIDWFDLNENCRRQFGIAARPELPAQDGIINTIIAATDVMLRTGGLTRDPLDGNPYLITNSTFLEELAKSGAAPVQLGNSGPAVFSALAAGEWAALREVGTFRVEAITFQSWNNLLTDEGKASVDRTAALLVNNYPNFRIIIRGHTGPGGDESENEKLSMERAAAVRQYLIAVHDIDPNRILAEGVGSKQPPPRKPGESPRAYQYRLPRVEFVAVDGNQL